METITVVISARNEETKIGRCLSSVHQLADEIIVIDNESSDQTHAIAKQFTSLIFERKNNLMLNVNKNYGFSKAKSDWILSLDADEVIPLELSKEIKTILAQSNNHVSQIYGYWIARKNILFGKWIQHGLWWPDEQLRLFRRGRGSFPCQHVHEYINVDGPTAHLANAFVHHNYETISQFIYKMDTIYTESEVVKLIDSKYQLAWYDALRFPISDFIKIYFAQAGYKDGLHGLVLSMLQSFYSFIVFVKLWERQKFKTFDISVDDVSNEMQKSVKDFRYWIISVHIQNSHSTLTRIWYKILRRLCIVPISK